jgi:hypothetical protein
MHEVGPVIREKLIRLFGEAEGTALAREVLGALGLRAIESPHDIYRFGDALTGRGGIYAILGHSIKTHAILNGALRTGTHGR